MSNLASNLPERARLQEQLEKILASSVFRTSRRCQDFLRFVVERSVDGSGEAIKERTIGIEVFGRSLDYATQEDAIVRVRANEVRKRLARYYAEEGAGDQWRLVIPSGSYTVEFLENGVAAAPQAAAEFSAEPPPKAKPDWRWLLALFLVAGTLLGAARYATTQQRATHLEKFWAPAFASGKPVVICSGHPVVYFLSRRIHEQYRAERGVDPANGPYVVELPPNRTLRAADIVPVTDQYVGVGDASAAAGLLALFAGRRKEASIRFGLDTSFADLRGAPTVLLGAYSNRWTMQMTDELRFFFDASDGVKKVRDRASRNRTWALPQLAPDGHTNEDFAIVSRVIDSKTGELLIAAAGLTQYGTRAAGEFLVSESRLREGLAGVAGDWPGRNVQVVLHTKVIGSVPGPPKVLASHVW